MSSRATHEANPRLSAFYSAHIPSQVMTSNAAANAGRALLGIGSMSIVRPFICIYLNRCRTPTSTAAWKSHKQDCKRPNRWHHSPDQRRYCCRGCALEWSCSRGLDNHSFTETDILAQPGPCLLSSRVHRLIPAPALVLLRLTVCSRQTATNEAWCHQVSSSWSWCRGIPRRGSFLPAQHRPPARVRKLPATQQLYESHGKNQRS